MTANAKSISVLVAGNPSGEAGFSDLAMYNNPQFSLGNDIHGGISEFNEYYLSVKIERAYTVYKIITTKVKSVGASRNGYLAIAFSIPKGYVLQNSDPYQVLMGLWDEFKKNCLTLKDPAFCVYEYNSTSIDSHVLDKAAEIYTLTAKNQVYRPMATEGSEKALIVNTAEKIKELLEDVQYKEFSSYSEILIAEHAGERLKYDDLSQLPIPRPVKYEVYVDEQYIQTVTDREEIIKTRSDKDSRFYLNKSKAYSLNQLVSGEGSTDGFRVDELNERIEVSTEGWAEPKKEEIQVSFNPEEAQSYFKEHKEYLSINVGAQKKTLDDKLKFSLVGEEIRSYLEDNIKIDTNQKAVFQYKNHTISCTLQTLTIITVKKVSKPKSVPCTGAKKTVDVKIVLYYANEKDFPEEKLDVCCETESGELLKTAIHLEKPDGESGQRTVEDVAAKIGLKFVGDPKKKKEQIIALAKNIKEAHLYIPTEWKNKKIWVTLTSRSGVICRSEKKNVANNDEVTFYAPSEFEQCKQGLAKEKLILIGACFIFFLLGGLSGFFIPKLFELSSEDKLPSENSTTVSDTQAPRQVGTIGASDAFSKLSEKEVENFLTQVDDRLKSRDVTFQEIEDMKYKYDSHQSDYNLQDEHFSVYNRLTDYAELVNAIKVGNISEAEAIVQRGNINKWHAKQVKALNGDADIATIHSFVDIASNSAPSAGYTKGDRGWYWCKDNIRMGGNKSCVQGYKFENELKDHIESQKHKYNRTPAKQPDSSAASDRLKER